MKVPILLIGGLLTAACAHTPPSPAAAAPPFRTVDLTVGETQEVRLGDGTRATLELVAIHPRTNGVTGFVDSAQLDVELNGQAATVTSGPYILPVTIGGLQIDCPVIRAYVNDDPIYTPGLLKDARFRLWPVGSPWLEPGAFGFPLRDRWLPAQTQLANERTYVGGAEKPGRDKPGHHLPLDIGGCEGLTEVLAATDGLVVSIGGTALSGDPDWPVLPRYDVVYMRDARGWYYRYSHLKAFAPSVKLGRKVGRGQPLGWLGKEGGSGGWAHLHLGVIARQPSGLWGNENSYPFLWEAYLRERKPALIAMARPHRLAWTGETVTLDGSMSWGRGLQHAWAFLDGGSASGPVVERIYATPGHYSEILKITDVDGREDYDFTSVIVVDRAHPRELPPTLDASFSPTLGVKPGDAVTFKVRTALTTDGEERWEFGDGSASVLTKSDGWLDNHNPAGYAVTRHRFARAGTYLVRVERANKSNFKAVGHLKVIVEEPDPRNASRTPPPAASPR